MQLLFNDKNNVRFYAFTTVFRKSDPGNNLILGLESDPKSKCASFLAYYVFSDSVADCLLILLRSNVVMMCAAVYLCQM